MTAVGVRKVARASVPEDATEALKAQIEQLPDDSSGDVVEPLDAATIDGRMPGEQPRTGDMPSESGGLMPGESPDDMPR